MLPVKLIIQRKTWFETKNQANYKYRSSYITVMRVDYHESPVLFKRINGMGIMETEAQFAKYLYDKLGEGEYMCLAWRKGREGFWNFLRVLCTKEGRWKRIEKKITAEDKELRDLKADSNKIRRRINEAETPEEKEEIRKEEHDTIEEYDFIKEIKQLDNTLVKRGPMGYLKPTLPVYKEHEYESYSNISSMSSDITLNEEKWL